MSERVRCEGAVAVRLSAKEALELFSPEGERRWVPGWDPRYPEAGADPRAVGTVFETDADSARTTWIVVERGAERVRYARVTPGSRAGLVSVDCRPGDLGTIATVAYDITALDAGTSRSLQAFAAGFPQAMAEWERRIAAALA